MPASRDGEATKNPANGRRAWSARVGLILGSAAVFMRSRPTRLLVVEDDPEMRSLLAGVLSRDGYEVMQAASGNEAIEALRRSLDVRFLMPDMLVMDVRMPGPSGLHVLKALRAAGWSVPVVLVTGFGSVELHREASGFGPVLVLDKPFDLDDLRAAIISLASARVEGAPPATQL
jgi:DNA-binding response OmpR family regulator